MEKVEQGFGMMEDSEKSKHPYYRNFIIDAWYPHYYFEDEYLDILEQEDLKLYQKRRDEDLECIWKEILTSLSNREIQCIHLHFFEGLSQANIAKLLNFSQPNVYYCIMRAMEKIKKRLAKVIVENKSNGETNEV